MQGLLSRQDVARKGLISPNGPAFLDRNGAMLKFLAESEALSRAGHMDRMMMQCR